MSVRLRLRRMGSRKRSFYRLVAADSRYQRDGRFLETLGYYDPMENPYKFRVNRERVLDWLRKGAQTTTTVNGLLRKEGIVQEYNLEKASAMSSQKSKKVSKSQKDSTVDGETPKNERE